MNDLKNKNEAFLDKLERKLQVIPVVGNFLAGIPAMISLIRSYSKKEYRDFPLGSVIAVVIFILYLLFPMDLIPDAIPGVGHIDDAGIFLACLKLIKSDIDDYLKWREKNKLN